jgi:hypothetical protein
MALPLNCQEHNISMFDSKFTQHLLDHIFFWGRETEAEMNNHVGVLSRYVLKTAVVTTFLLGIVVLLVLYF